MHFPRLGRLQACAAGLGLMVSAFAVAAPIERELVVVATIEATQDWKKNDPKYPGDQWSKGTATQRFEVRTRLRSDGKLELRNLLDPDQALRLEAKTIYLARQAKKVLEAQGQDVKLPTTPEEKSAFMQQMNRKLLACNSNQLCQFEIQIQYAALMAAIQYPEALEEETEPGRYLYFMPYAGCTGQARTTLNMTIEGVRYNKDSDKFVPFKETHTADSTTVQEDGIPMCRRYTAVIDTQDAQRPMLQETIHIPRPMGVTEYTENNHTAREERSQPLIMAAVDWINAELRHAKPEGEARTELPLALPLNQNATWLGLWTGTAKVHLKWSFREVKPVAAPASTTPQKP